jgi:hypothetical protein
MNSKPKVGVNVAMVKWDQLIVDVCVTIRREKVRMRKANMSIEEFQEREVSPTKG